MSDPFKVLNFISAHRHAGPATPIAKPASSTGFPPVAELHCGNDVKTAQVITLPRRKTATPAGGTSVEVISKVTEQVDKLFPQLKGAIRDDMIAAVSRQIAEDPSKRF